MGLELFAREVWELELEAVHKELAAFPLELALDADEAEVRILIPTSTFAPQLGEFLIQLLELGGHLVAQLGKLLAIGVASFLLDAFEQGVFVVAEIGGKHAVSVPLRNSPTAFDTHLPPQRPRHRCTLLLQLHSFRVKLSTKAGERRRNAAQDALQGQCLFRGLAQTLGVPELHLREQLPHAGHLKPHVAHQLLPSLAVLDKVVRNVQLPRRLFNVELEAMGLRAKLPRLIDVFEALLVELGLLFLALCGLLHLVQLGKDV
mmetsp:Transcript_49864/g.139560  ORF Transcript_49864/g.139560 Transcript_49864/m.139560 type:complete len:261 (+) Transcript_49864:1025-1807(+)